jgi:hypothetical protein
LVGRSRPSYVGHGVGRALDVTTKINQPIHIHPEDGKCSVCWTTEQFPLFDAAYTWKPKFCIEHQQRKPNTKSHCVMITFLHFLIQSDSKLQHMVS